MSVKRLVYVLANGGADDKVIDGPMTVAEARRFIKSANTDNGRINYFTVPASKFDSYCRTHSVLDGESEYQAL